MKYIYSVKGGIITLLFFSAISFFIPGSGSVEEIKIILTISTFLFAIMAGFFISRLNTRYDKMIDLVAMEDASWLAVYKSSMFYGKKFVDTIRELIDKYYIVAYDFDLGKHYKYTAKYFYGIYDELNKEKIKDEKTLAIFTRINVYLFEIEKTRNRSSVLSLEKLTKGQWTVLYLLSTIIIFSIFFLKVPGFYSHVTTVLLSTTVVLIMLVIRDLQNFRLTGDSILTESGQELFDVLGKLRYYNEDMIKNGTNKVPSYIEKYRLGLHKPGEEIKIKTIIK